MLASAALIASLAAAPASGGQLPLFDRVVELVRQNHDPAALRAPLLVVGAFEAWARADDRLQVRAEPPDRPASLELRTPAGSTRLDLGPVRSFAQAASTIRVGIDRLADLGLAPGSAEPRLVDGLLLALDPHCALLPPGSIGEGAADVGMRVGLVAGRAVVREVVPGGPGARAGVPAGAAIVSVDGESTLGVPPDRVADRLRGPAGRTVNLVVDAAGQRRSLQLTRELGATPLVTRARVEGAGYVRLARFGAGAAASVKEAVLALQREGALAGLVLDLRGNPGGLVDEAVELADLFLDANLIVETVGFGGRIREARWALPGSLALPLVILLDGDTASAAEIVAGALSLAGRAALAGDRSYGKGSVQVLYELGGGWGLKLTVAQYRLLRSTSLRGRGLVPDAVLRAVHAAGPETSGFAPLDLAGKAPPPGGLYLARTDVSKDPLVRAAARSLSAAPGRLDALKGRLRTEVRAAAARDARKLAAALAPHGVDWGDAGDARPRLSLELSTARLAGDRVELSLVVKNAGATAGHLRLWTRSPWLPLDRREIPLGRLASGKSFRGRIPFDAAGPGPTRVPITLHVDGDAGTLFERTLVLEVPGALSAGN